MKTRPATPVADDEKVAHDHAPHKLAAARGCLNGLMLAAVFWLLVGLVVWWLI